MLGYIISDEKKLMLKIMKLHLFLFKIPII